MSNNRYMTDPDTSVAFNAVADQPLAPGLVLPAMHLLVVLEQPPSPQGLGRWWKSSEALTVPAQK